tara:strand:- start:347 stop:2719 length:2373 start_codon:yes stop_codon:yes gene_type:complete
MELTIEQALQKGIEAHKAGRLQEADHYYTAILKANSRHPDANHNMGVLAVGVGRVSAALPFFKTALEENLSVAQYWLSYIDALIKLDHIKDAKAVFVEAKSKGAKGGDFDEVEKRLGLSKNVNTQGLEFQKPSQNQLQLLISLYQQRKFVKALNEASKLLMKYPNSAVLYNIVGFTNSALGNRNEAVASYTKAIKTQPNYATAYNNMGLALRDQGKLDEAIVSYAEAINNRPNYATAYNNMGLALRDQGKLDKAIAAYAKALAIKPDLNEAYYNMGIALKGTIFNEPNRELQKIITFMLRKRRYARPLDVARAAISLLKFEPTFQEQLKRAKLDDLTNNPENVISELNKFPLLLQLMKACPLPDLELEALLKELRASVLANISHFVEASNEMCIFQSALALQCFNNEYIYNQTKEEEKNLQSLEKAVETTLQNNEQPSSLELLVLASYKALNQYSWYHLLIVKNETQEVFTRQIKEPQEEKEFRSQITMLENVTDNVSLKVKKQYEENPYPRWTNLAISLELATMSKIADKLKLKIYDESIVCGDAPNVLIAGCGTGQHSISSAARFRTSKILAIDLSLSSLAYAKRKSEELGIKNLEYMHADILTLRNLNKQFDLIESVGVLHHMHNPMAGWKVLVDCLKPSGLMRIGLYSKLARHHIVKVRDEINQLGIGSSNAEMKYFRDEILRSDKEHHRMICNVFDDIYSLSMFRDLLFHVQEHRFTIPDIKVYLEELGLKFCGFENRGIVSHFKLTNTEKDDPYDLDKWHLYELDNPNAFTGMYQFWCQKIERI